LRNNKYSLQQRSSAIALPQAQHRAKIVCTQNVMSPALKSCFERMINVKENNFNVGQIGKIEI
jgi:hypothetical protein